MSNPNKYALRMILLLIIVVIIVYFLYEPLRKAFDGNREINSLIIFTFLIGILLAFRQTFRLKKEGNWLKLIQKNDFFPDKNMSSTIKPELLAPIAALLMERKNEDSSLSANSNIRE